MKKLLFINVLLFCALTIFAQQTINDRAYVKQVNSKYPSLTVRTYQGLHDGGHPHVMMQNWGGKDGALKPTPSGRLLGTVIYSGYDGKQNVQVGRVSVQSTGVFSEGSHPVKMNFQLGGKDACCGVTRMTIDGQTGNVGIGTSNPGGKLDVNGRVNAKDIVFVKQDKSKYPSFTVRTYQGLHDGGHPHIMMQNWGGKDGALKATPSGRLLGTIIYSGHDGTQNVQVGRISVRSEGEFSKGNHPAKMYFQLGGSAACCGATRMIIDGKTGNVGIGTASPKSKLAVNGEIRAKEINVMANIDVPDYVFKEDYDLPSISSTKEYINENKHLPGIPSASEIGESGINVGEMNLMLLKKIEELTLYIIDQNERIESLEEKLSE